MGKNIRYLRRERGWSMAKLASKIGTSEVVLGRIERSVNAPSALLLFKLTKALGVSADALFATKPEKLHRQRFGTDKAPFLVASEICDELPPKIRKMAREVIAAFRALEDIRGAHKRAKIPLHVNFEADEKGMEELAITVRRYMGVEHAVIFDYLELFENSGFRVVSAPFDDFIDSFSYFDPPNQNAFFFINEKKNVERRLFSLVRELGSILIHTASLREGGNPFITRCEDLEEGKKEFTSYRAARRFAATYLMPEKAVRDTVGQLGLGRSQWSMELLLRIKHRFGVSAESFLYRLGELGLIDPELAEPIKEKIYHHYEKTGYAEPAGSKRVLISNGRLGDLILAGRADREHSTEVSRIEEMLDRWRITYED